MQEQDNSNNLNIDKNYAPQEMEQAWYQYWEEQGYFAPQPQQAKSFCIMLPPPNVTGSLHMGHGFGTTLMDILIRYQRMCGKNTLWQPGTDHASIATQMVVERNLNREGISRHDLGREKFLEKAWAWKEFAGGNITRQLRRLGASLDWSREKFTLDDDISEAVSTAFVKLYEEGLIYQGTRLVNWDPQLQTAVSDLEVIYEEVAGEIWHIQYQMVNDSEIKIIVATTRPETLFGDVAVAVHPDDARYKHLIGQQVKLPLTDKLIPIIADAYVEQDFGTGCLKITPAHDFNDYAVGKRHGFEPVNILTIKAELNDNVPIEYRGLSTLVARKKVLADLKAQGLLIKSEKHHLKIPRGEKSNAIIEPYLTKQWFIKMETLAAPAIAAVESGAVKFVPENWTKTFFQWMHHIEDWCISRQLWWGHRIPIWYDAKGNAYVGLNEQDARARHSLSAEMDLTQDNDVLDTWFSSGLWPFATLGWPAKTADLEKFFPTDVLITGFDIIFFWVARMLMFSLKFTGTIPFKEIYITGLIRDAEGQKMSKTKGNVIDPIDLIDGISLPELLAKRTAGLIPATAQKIEKSTQKEFPEGIAAYGTDALRFTFCAVATYTRDIRFDTNRLAGYRNFCNKLWNACRYVRMQTQDFNAQSKYELSLADRWIWSRLQSTITNAHHALTQYRFDFYAQTLYDFTWNEFCDWYLELSKPTLFAEQKNPERLCATQYTLLNVLEILLRLLHPIIPFITEELWHPIQALLQSQNKLETIMLSSYPQADTQLENPSAEHEMQFLQKVIIAIRTIRSEMNISPAKRLSILLRNGSNEDQRIINENLSLLITMAKLTTVSEAPADLPPAASAFVGALEIYIPFADFIDAQAEIKRLQKEIEKIEKDLAITQNKLNQASFIEKAPTVVVEKEKLRAHDLKQTVEKLNIQLSTIRAL